MRRATAPENAPFSWPNSSDSSRFSGIAAQFSATNGPRGAARAAMDVARQHLLAGARLAGDQHRGLRRGHLLGAVHRGLHGGIAHHHRVAFAGGGFQDGGDQVGIGRQRQEFARAVADRLRRGLRIVAGAAGDDRHRDALGGERAHHRADVVRQVAQHQIDARIGAQPRQRGVRVVRLVELRPARDRDARRLASSPASEPMIRTRIAGLTSPGRS